MKLFTIVYDERTGMFTYNGDLPITLLKQFTDDLVSQRAYQEGVLDEQARQLREIEEWDMTTK